MVKLPTSFLGVLLLSLGVDSVIAVPANGTLPVNNVTAPAIEYPLKNPPKITVPSSKSWWVLDDMNFTTTAGEVGTAHNNVNWTWTKDASNPPTLGLVWFVLRNADTSVLASPTGFAGLSDFRQDDANGHVNIGFTINGSEFPAAPNYTIQFVRESNWSMVFAESEQFEIKPVGSALPPGLPAPSSALTHTNGVVAS
ncbi:uncharacterized protein EHS24_002452 [Apiotrichum porosum]|uniref:Uncharacterized protein n=1 Tax=Apiotrichum porosum TaxID=105984 RepID=A0A427XGH2_9TREE|nr:uncharacterized protein EHS24_002452 [Apiotrichum porosum]RSH78001.1 hypothetical protein EHS24_002452 [Apiotrichum porosum]